MRINIPPGTTVEVDLIHRVIITFHTQDQAIYFVKWLEWLDQQPNGKELIIERKEIPLI